MWRKSIHSPADLWRLQSTRDRLGKWSVTPEPQQYRIPLYGMQRDCFLSQHVTLPTHRRGDQRANTLDLILSNEEGMVYDLSYEAPLGKSHHCSLVFKFKCYTEPKASKVKSFKYDKGDYDQLRRIVSQYDLEEVNQLSCEEGWKYEYFLP